MKVKVQSWLAPVYSLSLSCLLFLPFPLHYEFYEIWAVYVVHINQSKLSWAEFMVSTHVCLKPSAIQLHITQNSTAHVCSCHHKFTELVCFAWCKPVGLFEVFRVQSGIERGKRETSWTRNILYCAFSKKKKKSIRMTVYSIHTCPTLKAGVHSHTFHFFCPSFPPVHNSEGERRGGWTKDRELERKGTWWKETGKGKKIWVHDWRKERRKMEKVQYIHDWNTGEYGKGSLAVWTL